MLNFENIQMSVVRRKDNGLKININEINDENRYDEYECIVCGSDVISVVPNGKTVNGNDAKVTPHFKHLNSKQCTSESFLHFWSKTEFLKIGDKFKIVTDIEEEYICNQIFFEKPITLSHGKYIPDVTVYTSCGNIIHFEISYSNTKKVKDYIDKWKELNHIIVEVDMNTILSVFSNETPIFKALYYENKCFNLNTEDNLYYNTIGKYKITKNDEKILKNRKLEIEKLDWLWDQIRQVSYDNKNLEEIGNILHSISSEETRDIAIDIMKRSKCSNLFKNYVSFIKSKIDKRLKLLNLKYNGYLVKYETEIPRLVYDRIFKGIIINLIVPNSIMPEIYQTYNYNFKDEILSDNFKSRIDEEVKKLKYNNDMLLKILDIFNKNNKILIKKIHCKENTDYIDSIFIQDYRYKKFIIYKDYGLSNYDKSVFSNYIDENTELINICGLFDVDKFYIYETEKSYEFKNYISKEYKFRKIINQDKINITYKRLNKSFDYLNNFDFVKVTSDLNDINKEIQELLYSHYNIKDMLKIYDEKDEYKNKIYLTNASINNKIINILKPLINASEKCDSNELNIILNKNYTRDALGTRAWIVKDFIESLKKIGITNIKNIL